MIQLLRAFYIELRAYFEVSVSGRGAYLVVDMRLADVRLEGRDADAVFV